MSEAALQIWRGRPQLDYLPIGVFGSVMGMTGLSVGWRLTLAYFAGPRWLAMVPLVIGVIAIVVFVAILAGYAVKAITAFDVVRAEFRHPIAGNLFGTTLRSFPLSACWMCRSRYRYLDCRRGTG